MRERGELSTGSPSRRRMHYDAASCMRQYLPTSQCALPSLCMSLAGVVCSGVLHRQTWRDGREEGNDERTQQLAKVDSQTKRVAQTVRRRL